jgi:phosphatidylglycerophosphate synthase
MDPTPLADESNLHRLRRAAAVALAGGAALLVGLLIGVVSVFAPAAGRPGDQTAGELAGSLAGGLADRAIDHGTGTGAISGLIGLAVPAALAEALYMLAALLVLHALPAHRAAGEVFARFGPANHITLLRLVLVALLAALLAMPLDASLRWFVVATASLAAALDGLDGALARRTGLGSAFGARFDMETDALLVMVLSLLVWHAEVAGVWALLSGLLRYLFVAAATVWPWLARTLPASLRRKTVCVLQIVLLIACLVPGLPAGVSAALAAIGLALLLHSFGTDVVWLHRHRSPGRSR